VSRDAATPAGRRRAAARAASTQRPAAEATKPSAPAPKPSTPATKPGKPAPQPRPAATRTRRKPAKPRSPAARPRRPAARWRRLPRGAWRLIRRLPRAAWRLIRGTGSLRRRAAVALLAVLALAAVYYGWFRDSSLVSVDNVKVEGLAGGATNPAAAALTGAAKDMTTLDVDTARLDEVAAQFPEIASVSADPAFPHGMTIRVVDRPPVLLARDGPRTVPVAGDGTLLVGAGSPKQPKLPTVAVHPLPASGRVGGRALEEARVAGAAPAPLRRELVGLSFSHDEGVTATLHGGIHLRFGTAGAARAKWAAAAAVLADRRLTTLAYVDVRVPQRPAVG
jgi:cell division protein FtsQ